MKSALLVVLALASLLLIMPSPARSAVAKGQEYSIEPIEMFPAILPCEIVVSRQTFAEATIQSLIFLEARRLVRNEKTRVDAFYLVGASELSPWDLGLSGKEYLGVMIEIEKELAKQQKEIGALSEKAIMSKNVDDWSSIVAKRELLQSDTKIANWLWHDFLAKRTLACPSPPPVLGPKPLTDKELEKTTAP